MRLCAALVCAAIVGPAAAHEVGLSYGVYTADVNGVSAELIFAEKELGLLADGVDTDGDGKTSDAEIATATAALTRDVLEKVSLSAGESTCRWTFTTARRVEADGVAVLGRGSCPSGASRYAVSLGFLDRATPGHRHLVRAIGPGAAPIDLVTHKNDRAFSIAGAAGDAQASSGEGGATGFGGMLLLGIEHILGGLDHLLFLLGLVLVGGRVKALIGVITAFTIAHSITLGLAVLGVWAPSPSLVEPLIALSVTYVAVENWFVKDAGKRWPLTFAFGLIHGFGFAGALGELRVPKEDIPALLVGFNLGVEIGQLAVLAVVLPLLFWLRKKPWFTEYGVRAISIVLALFGLFWFFERILA